MTETDVLTFEQLRNIRKKERKEDTLQELEDDFFARARDYLARKKRKARGNYSSEYVNAKHLVEDIVDSRQKKILRLAFLSNKSNLSVDNLLPEEEDLFNSVRNDIQQQRDAITAAIFNVEQEGAESQKSGTEEEETFQEKQEQTGTEEQGETVEEGETSVEESSEMEEDTPYKGDPNVSEELDDEEEDNEMLFDASSGYEDESESEEYSGGPVAVEFTAEVKAFMGTDMEEYGPFEEGDTVELPKDNADVLEKQGKARILD